MFRRRRFDDETDDRPPICPACGVTQGMVVSDGETRFLCLECGFSDDEDQASVIRAE
jgi:tRNA(Ile2) C34 agmatinyltransferase TiaS